MSDYWNNKNILLLGGTGTIGAAVFKSLLEKGVERHRIKVDSLDNDERARAVLGDDLSIYERVDVTDYQQCLPL